MSLSEEARTEVSWELYEINTDLSMALLCFDDLQDKYFGKFAAQVPYPEYAKIQAGLHCIRELLIKTKIDLALLTGDEDNMVIAYIEDRNRIFTEYAALLGGDEVKSVGGEK